MIISYYGNQCIKMQCGESILAIDPFGKGSDRLPPRFEAHIVILTNPEDTQSFSLTGKPIVFSTPGEYEIRGISIVGFSALEATPFFAEWEGIHVLHLGNISKRNSIEQILEGTDTVDILFITASGNTTETGKIISYVDPRIIIPMHKIGTKKTGIDQFIKETGMKPERIEKLTTKRNSLPAEGQRLIILETHGEKK